MGDESNEEVILGPDLNPTRSRSDKKLYRHITLANGLKCVLICDTVAMRQRKMDGYYDSDSEDEDDDDEGEEGSDGEEGSEGEEEEDDDDGLRKAATALLVNVGSYHDPPHLQGLSWVASFIICSFFLIFF